ncbi:hypothetical protein Amet_2592 [Alkaliphilus metalliredigens QYMF]|uniref:Uncharacterized protein n=1 Tax=Alkaliphilus metalliredigens (strain QYMF) TaxID=293826 RepID=A6TRC6_ALKMQ|nr:hypothetical protein Amet_2592 [Alkaliphilus metalliredigens QYMF]
MKVCKYAKISGINKGIFSRHNSCEYLQSAKERQRINEFKSLQNRRIYINEIPICPKDCLRNKAGDPACFIVNLEEAE